MKTRLVVSVLALVYGILPVNAQSPQSPQTPQSSQTSGSVLNPDRVPVQFATVRLLNGEKLFIKGALTDSLGRFIIQHDSAEGRFIRVEHFYYQPETIDVGADDKPLEIILQPLVNQIEGVVVSGQQPVTYRDGSIIVNTTLMPDIDKLQAIKVLERLPGVIKTAREGYTINGLKATIYINGIKQQISDASLTSYLESLPANVLSEVELVPNALGNYDAGTGAVINIKTKKDMPQGIHMQVGTSASLFDAKLNNIGGEFFFMVKKRNILFNTSTSYSNNNDYMRSSDSTSYSTGIARVNHGHTTGRNNVVTSHNNLTWNLKNDHRLDFNAFVYYDIDNYKTNWRSLSFENNGTTESRYRNKTRGNDDMWAGSVYYTSPQKRKFRVKAYYSGMYGGLRAKKDYFRTLDEVDPYMKSDVGMVGQMHSLVADLESDIFEGMTLQYGAKLNLNSLTDHADYKNPSGGADFSNSIFRGREILPAGYLMAKYAFNKALSMTAAGRVEHTDYKLRHGSAASHSDRYTNFFPSAALFFNAKNYNANLGFSSRISRPNYEWLLPGIRYINEFNYTEGNPHIAPMTYYFVAFNNSFFQVVGLSLRYENLKNVFGEVFMRDENSATYRTYLNYADLERYYITLNVPYRFLDGKIYGQLVSTIHWADYKNFRNGYELPRGRDTRFFTGNMRINFQYDITERLNFNAAFKLDPTYRNIPSTRRSTYRLDMGVSYALLPKKNLILDFSVANVLNSENSQVDNYFLDNYSYAWRQVKGPVYKFSLKFRLNKGQRVMDEYRNNTPAIERMGRK
jgi:hypothetical protein